MRLFGSVGQDCARRIATLTAVTAAANIRIPIFAAFLTRRALIAARRLSSGLMGIRLAMRRNLTTEAHRLGRSPYIDDLEGSRCSHGDGRPPDLLTTHVMGMTAAHPIVQIKKASATDVTLASVMHPQGNAAAITG